MADSTAPRHAARQTAGRADPKTFPFDLTDAQQKAVWQIARDLQSGRPMNRLLQGDVGSGKTVVAVYAMLVGVDEQAAIGPAGADRGIGRAALPDTEQHAARVQRLH